MYTSLRNGAIDYMKKRQHEFLSDEYIEVETSTLEDVVLNTELKKIIKKAIDSLDKKSKYVFVQTEIMGRSYKDLVKETGKKLGTLLSRKSRATKKLAIILKEYLYKEEKNYEK